MGVLRESGGIAMNINAGQDAGCRGRRIWCSFHGSMPERESEDDMVLLLVIGYTSILAFIQKLSPIG
ncbi:hypothetical protein N7491_010672 [Penicillium cf. griseofulvum]|nr:hypothetical protein N7491_010672 [Penicillium cf. griseofulvum]